jgi:hypothetical protein
MDKDTTTSTLTEYLKPIKMKSVFKQIEHLELDKYTKKLDTLTFANLMIFAQLNEISSLASR